MTELNVRTLDDEQTIRPGEIERLRSRISGSVLTPASADYDEARSIWNAMIDRRPGAIVRCATADDVIRAVGFARERRLVVAVRSGGHNIAGNAVCDGGIVINLSLMNWVTVDPQARTAI
ncbi:MAG: FAD-binding oxidoreductase, partial [Geminicoccaceae bacterium]